MGPTADRRGPRPGPGVPAPQPARALPDPGRHRRRPRRRRRAGRRHRLGADRRPLRPAPRAATRTGRRRSTGPSPSPSSAVARGRARRARLGRTSTSTSPTTPPAPTSWPAWAARQEARRRLRPGDRPGRTRPSASSSSRAEPRWPPAAPEPARPRPTSGASRRRRARSKPAVRSRRRSSASWCRGWGFVTAMSSAPDLVDCTERTTGCGQIRSAIQEIFWQRSSDVDTPTRLLRLLSLLSARACWSAADLAAETEVTERTVRRDITRLRELGYPVEATTGRHGGYTLGRAAACRHSCSTTTRRSPWRSAAGRRGGAGGHRVGALSALAKLDQVLPAEPARAGRGGRRGHRRPPWRRRARGRRRPDSSPPALACRRPERLRFTYRDADDRLTDRTRRALPPRLHRPVAGTSWPSTRPATTGAPSASTA